MKLKILCVDDDEMIRSVQERAFRLSGLGEVKTASSAEEAIEMLQKESFDVIVSDMLMGGLSGADLHKWLVEQELNVANRFIVCSGGMRPSQRAYVEEVGCPFFSKPFYPSQIIETIRNLTRGQATF